MKNFFSSYRCKLAFVVITLIYLFSRWIIFKGFTGEDDLHYAMLASNMVHGNYDPFVAGDIFAGRMFLIAIQSFIYWVCGVSIFATFLGTTLVTVLCCYLTAFKLLRNTNANSVLISSSLFYFNPVLIDSTIGVMPDIYIVLAGIIILLLWRNILSEQKHRATFLHATLIGLTAFAGMLFKETALIFIPFIFCIALMDRRIAAIKAALIAIVTFCTLIVIAGFVYEHFAGDFFFRVQQMQNSSYSSPCNYAAVGQSRLITRLTYDVWTNFIAGSFYPAIFASLIVLLRIIFDKTYSLKKDRFAIYFIILVLLSLYFPFSLKGYQPLCYKPRHFLFLLPLAVAVSTPVLMDASNDKRLLRLCTLTSAILFIMCIILSEEKWYWMMYALLFAYFLLQNVLSANSPFCKLRYLILSAVLWVYMPYHLFFGNSDWFKDMQRLSQKLNGKYFYFPEHDNMMNWKLLHSFDKQTHSFNLGTNSFKPATLYYEHLDTLHYHPGWFIVNRKFAKKSDLFLDKMDSLTRVNYFSKQIKVGDVHAVLVDHQSQLSYLRTLVSN